MQANDSGGKVVKGFRVLAGLIEEVEAKGELFGVPPEAVLAVIVKESYGSQWFCKCDAQYRDNMRTAKAFTEKTEAQILDAITVRRGPNKGNIPKFRYEPSWSAKATALSRRTNNAALWKLRLNCSYGLGQKGMVWHLAAKPIEEWEVAFWLFVESPHEQIKVCAHDLSILRKQSPGDWHTVFTRYNAGPGKRGITTYSEKVVELMHQFSTGR